MISHQTAVLFFCRFKDSRTLLSAPADDARSELNFKNSTFYTSLDGDLFSESSLFCTKRKSVKENI
jgi:hypothetical protein